MQRSGSERPPTASLRPLEVRRLGLVPYGEGLKVQEELVGHRRAGRVPDQLLLLEHPHVITMGTGTDPSHLLADERERVDRGIELFDSGRGGDITYHGPGQLVGYPILDLKPDRKDLHRYLRDLESALILVLDAFGIEARRAAGLTGVWTERGKVAAIGVRVSSGWITSHGFALNVTTDLEYFSAIVPCGLEQRSVTSLQELLGRPVSMDLVMDRVTEAMAETFGRRPEPFDGQPDSERIPEGGADSKKSK
ncbi:MAG: lipoyl(octanoyl) transferase LipB [Gemmatimonadales bacterium]|nr:MAG: lipoyl(octanoyl) transferase LipB [Gemmatimonadales bacterium]